MMQSLNLLRTDVRGGGGTHGFIVPKSFLYASTWRIPRDRLLDGLEILVDCGRAWDEVKLEQVIYLHRSGAKTPTYRNLKREEQQFETVNTIDKREYQRFEIYVNGVDDSELQIAHQMLKGQNLLGDHITNTRGAGLQRELELSPYFVLALLNSKLINWYVYRFIYAKAVMTMHFDSPVTSRIPLPNYAAYPDLISSIVAEVKKIYMNRRANEKLSQSRIDKYIFQLYGLSPQQTALVEENMP